MVELNMCIQQGPSDSAFQYFYIAFFPEILIN